MNVWTLTNDAAGGPATLAGELRYTDSPALRQALAPVLGAAQAPEVRLDLSQVTALDCSTVAVLLETARKLEAGGRTLRLVSLSEAARKIFKNANALSAFRLS